uniref:NADH-ubiquinone oxidoreductase chain 2 n=2 Tax=Laudakia vulgaris brachydactyla TaxID=3240327 RepID=C0SPE0_9SAUR|nr:NADH dehydrogenase subunit 2 [Stellagama stellio brachydactyla]
MPNTAMMMIMMGITTGTIMVMSNHHWVMTWAGLEMNMLAILPIISKPKTLRSTEAATKYFLTQAIASTMMLLSSTMNAWQNGNWDITQLNNNYATAIMAMALTMKMGAAPLHFWFPEVMQGSTLGTALLLTTWQKMAPITVMYTISNHTQPTILMSIGILSIIIGGLGGINQKQLRKIMAYSSINNMGWTISTMPVAPKIAMMNIAIYIIMITPTFLLMMTTSTKTLQDISTMWTTSPTTTYTIAMLMLSTSGLPPLTGFAPKLLMLNELITQNLTGMATLMALLSLISLLFYLRITYLIMMLTSPSTTPSSTKWRHQNHQPQLTAIITPAALLSISLIPAMPY